MKPGIPSRLSIFALGAIAACALPVVAQDVPAGGVPTLVEPVAGEPPADPGTNGAATGVDIKAVMGELAKQYKIPADALQSIQKPSQEIAASMARINDLLKGNVDKIRNAEKEIEAMLGQVEEAANAAKPDGAFVKAIEELVGAAKAEAQAARDRGSDRDVALQRAYEQFASDFETSKEKASKFYADSFRIIRELRAEKARLVQGLKLQQFVLAKQNVQAGLELVEKAHANLKSVQESLPQGSGAVQ
jgi:uncharacterized protein (UPF0335 family)